MKTSHKPGFAPANLSSGLQRRQFLSLAMGFSTCLMLLPAHAAAYDAVTALFNDIRHANGLGSMTPAPWLAAAAWDQASRMAFHKQVNHTLSLGHCFAARICPGHIHHPAAENLSAGQRDARAAFMAWMHSPGHRRNMLDAEFTHYGLACATAKDKPACIYWALVLAR